VPETLYQCVTSSPSASPLPSACHCSRLPRRQLHSSCPECPLTVPLSFAELLKPASCVPPTRERGTKGGASVVLLLPTGLVAPRGCVVVPCGPSSDTLTLHVAVVTPRQLRVVGTGPRAYPCSRAKLSASRCPSSPPLCRGSAPPGLRRSSSFFDAACFLKPVRVQSILKYAPSSYRT